MRSGYDVVVVGAGPGGATAASFLGRAGVRTLLVDKAHFPRDKSCGDAVCSRSVSILRELGLEGALSQLPGHRASAEIFLNDRGDGLTLPFVTRRGRFGEASPREVPGRPDLEACPAYVIPRHAFDDFLFQHARSFDAVDVLEGFFFEDFLRDEAGRVVGVSGRDEDGRTHRIAARLVIGADGAMSKVAERAGAYDFRHKNHAHWIAAFRIYFDGVAELTDAMEIHFLDAMLPGYLWIFPVGEGRANVGAGMVETYARGGRDGKRFNLKQAGYALLREHPRLKERFGRAHEVKDSFLGWQLPCGSERRRLSGNGWMLVGDAASLIDPFSGEGIANAMTSARFAARTAIAALRDGGALRGYDAAVWRELGEELETSTRLQKLARHTWLVNWLLHRAATRPRLQREIQELKARDEGGKLTHPLYLARVLTM